MAQGTVILTHIIHHPTQGGEIRCYQGDTWMGIHIYLQADPNIPLYGEWSDVCPSDASAEEILACANKLLHTFISVVYETDWE